MLISGSAEVYGDWKKEKALKFIHDLSKRLAADGHKIVSGFGVGVGSAVINGVLDHTYSTNYQHLDEYLVLRPFPQVATGTESLKSMWTNYRKEMISHSGVAIFIFGNKKNQEGEIVLANGIDEEFDLAVKQGLKVIPVGATGFTSKQLWDKVKPNLAKHLGSSSKIKALFNKIGNAKTTPAQLIKAIKDLIDLLQEK